MTRAPIALAALCAATLAPSVARPCGNAVYVETDEANRLIARATKELDAGRYRRAIATLDDGSTRVDDRSLEKRMSLILATARLRLGRTTAAAWGLDHLNQAHPGDPEIQTRLGEVLVTLGTSRAAKKAVEILGALERDDLMADARGYLALATVRARRGDEAGAKRALERCKRMARAPEICTLEGRKRPAEKTEPDPRPPTS